MAENEKLSLLGKKIFFVFPSAFTQNQVIPELAQEEFEVYTVKDQNKFLHLIRKYPDAVMFANINESMKETDWEKLIRAIQNGNETKTVAIGIIASISDDNLKKKYLEQLKVNCGYTVIKSDIGTATKQLISNLNNVDAKGRRKYIRLMMDKEPNATANFPIHGTFVNGVIKDISAVGFSCVFTDDPGFKKNSLYSDIQLRLQSQLLKAEAIVFGSRIDGSETVYVFLLSQRVDPNVRTRIRKYIQANLQHRMEEEFK